MTFEFELVLGDSYPFKAGEILIVDDHSGREMLGIGRKASKWDVETQTFDTAEQAASDARERGLTPCLPDDYPETLALTEALRSLLEAIG